MSVEPVNGDERWLAAEVAAGRIADFTARPGGNGELVDIRGGFIRWLALTVSRPAGLAVRGVRVTGFLDLQLCQLNGPLVLRDCLFAEPLDFSKALLVDVDLSGSNLPGLNATSTSIRHDLTLVGVQITGATVLVDASVGGLLNLNSGTFTNSNADAIIADGVRVDGNVLCGEGFRAEGKFRLPGATIGGSLDLTSGTFINPHGSALHIERAHIKGSVFCQGFHAQGVVLLLSATIGGQLNLTGGTFTNPQGKAIVADGIRVEGGMFCHAGFNAEGEVRLLGATISGLLTLTGGTFTNPRGNALNADGIRVKGGMFCDAGFNAEGEVRLLGATISGPLSLTGGTFTNPHGDALSVDSIRVEGGMFCGEGFRAEGEVRLLSAKIDGTLSLTGGTFTNPHGEAISADRAQIDTLNVGSLEEESTGRISLVGAYAGYLADDLISWQRFSTISLLDFTYDRILTHGWSTKSRLAWLQQDPEYRAQPYEHLAQTLRAQGHEREARDVMVAKNRRRRDQHQSRLRKIPEYLFDWLLVYGYHPLQRTVPALILLYMLGIFLFSSARDHHSIIATRASIHQSTTVPGTATGGVATSPPTTATRRPVTATATCPPDYPCFSPWAFTADALIPLINTHQTDFWAVSGATQAGRWAIHYSWLASALGWLLTTAAALGFTGLIRRE